MADPNTPEWYECKADLAKKVIDFYATQDNIDKMLLWTCIEDENRQIAAMLKKR